MAAAAALVGCLLPWERIEARTPVDDTTTALDALHGWGLLACAGASIALLSVADRAVRPAPSGPRESAALLAGLALMAGSALFPLGGGFAVGDSVGGQSRVTLGPGLPLAGVAGLVLAAISLLRVWSRRGAWPRRRSAA